MRGHRANSSTCSARVMPVNQTSDVRFTGTNFFLNQLKGASNRFARQTRGHSASRVKQAFPDQNRRRNGALAGQGRFSGFGASLKSLSCMVGAERFELSTPSPPDWCANLAAPRSDRSRGEPAGPVDLAALAAKFNHDPLRAGIAFLAAPPAGATTATAGTSPPGAA
jgi:hypothetical protein